MLGGSGNPFFLNADQAYAGYAIGDWTYGKPIVYQWDPKCSLTIGKFCSIADGVKILLGGEHRTNWVSTYPFNMIARRTSFFFGVKGVEGHPASKGNVVIGNDVWIGSHAIILSGVTIHDGAVVGAGSVVTKDVASYAIVAGSPARQIRPRFDEGTISALLKIAWWNWPLPKIEEALPLILSGDIEVFIQRYGQ